MTEIRRVMEDGDPGTCTADKMKYNKASLSQTSLSVRASLTPKHYTAVLCLQENNNKSQSVYSLSSGMCCPV